MKKLYQIALEACKKAYISNTDLGTTEYTFFNTIWKGEELQVLAIAGTNEFSDWFKNIDIRSCEGLKLSGVQAAEEIWKDINIKDLLKPKLPLLLTSHSKGTAACVAFKKIHGAEHCVLFNPVRCMSRLKQNILTNTTMFVDQEDIVSKLACLSFKLPSCTTIIKPKDQIPWWKIYSNHELSAWDEIVFKNKEI